MHTCNPNAALRKLRQEDSHKFKATLGHIAESSRPAWDYTS